MTTKWQIEIPGICIGDHVFPTFVKIVIIWITQKTQKIKIGDITMWTGLQAQKSPILAQKLGRFIAIGSIFFNRYGIY